MTKLFVGGLSDDGQITAEDLRPLFEEFGVVEECDRIKNYAFVRMPDEDSAMEAISKLNGRMVKGRSIKVEKSESKGPRKPTHKLFVGNIGVGTSASELKALVEKYIPVLEADVIKNYGFVHIDVESSRQRIDEIVKILNGETLGGCSIRVEISTSKVRHKPGMGGDHCFKCGKSGHWSKECPSDPRSFRSDRSDSGHRDSYSGPIRRDRGSYGDRSFPYRSDDKFRRSRPQRSGDFDEFDRGTNRSDYFGPEHSAPRSTGFSSRSPQRGSSSRVIYDYDDQSFRNGPDPFGNAGNKMSASDSRYDFERGREQSSFRPFEDAPQNPAYRPKPAYPDGFHSTFSFDSKGYSGSSGSSYQPRPSYSTAGAYESRDPHRQPYTIYGYEQDTYSSRPAARGSGYDAVGPSPFSAGTSRGGYGMY